MQKVLVIRFSSIGDIVLTTPVLRALKEQAGAEVHFLTKARYAPLLRANPRIDRLFTLGTPEEAGQSLKDLLPKLRAERYDFVLDLHKNLRSLRTRFYLRRPAGTFPKLNLRKWLLVRFKWNTLPPIHLVQRYMQAGRQLGLRYDGKGLEHFIPEEEEVRIEDFLRLSANAQGPLSANAQGPLSANAQGPLSPASHQGRANAQGPLSPASRQGRANAPLIAVAIGGTYATKRLPPEKLTELCARLPGQILLLGGPEDRAVGEQIAQKDHIINLCGRLSMQQSASVLAQSDLVLAHDTGMMHIAAALKKPIISIWGNTVPDFGMYPLFPDDMPAFELRAEVQGLSCRPCSKLGFDICPKGHFRCMQEQDLDKILRLTSDFLSENRHL